MTISEKRIKEYQDLARSYLGIEMSPEHAKVEAYHLVRILRILKRKSV